MTDREDGLTRFLLAAGWGAAERRHLAGDASDRRYERLRLGAATAVLMDNPPGGADDPSAFVAMARHLQRLGLSAPDILSADLCEGFLLLEDLGDDLFSRLLLAEPGREAELYAAATDCLLHLQAGPPPVGLPNLSAADWAAAASFALEWYAFAATGARPDPAEFLDRMTAAMMASADRPRVLILRDFHADNLLWLPGRSGLARVGLLDFQLGQLGQPGYDLVSLLQDARRDVTPETEAAMTARFATVSGVRPEIFAAQYATLGAQRSLRIMGVFTRLCLQAGKPAYLRLLPRVWGQLQRNLRHPALADLRLVCDALLPPPTPDILQRIESQCQTTPSR
jgi:aminoglycoside/choline kinase family phosphotransferase